MLGYLESLWLTALLHWGPAYTDNASCFDFRPVVRERLSTVKLPSWCQLLVLLLTVWMGASLSEPQLLLGLLQEVYREGWLWEQWQPPNNRMLVAVLIAAKGDVSFSAYPEKQQSNKYSEVIDGYLVASEVPIEMDRDQRWWVFSGQWNPNRDGQRVEMVINFIFKIRLHLLYTKYLNPKNFSEYRFKKIFFWTNKTSILEKKAMSAHPLATHSLE